jgi:tRNA(Arg) A34 adenosine deaminase TadA
MMCELAKKGKHIHLTNLYCGLVLLTLRLEPCNICFSLSTVTGIDIFFFLSCDQFNLLVSIHRSLEVTLKENLSKKPKENILW